MTCQLKCCKPWPKTTAPKTNQVSNDITLPTPSAPPNSFSFTSWFLHQSAEYQSANECSQ